MRPLEYSGAGAAQPGVTAGAGESVTSAVSIAVALAACRLSRLKCRTLSQALFIATMNASERAALKCQFHDYCRFSVFPIEFDAVASKFVRNLHHDNTQQARIGTTASIRPPTPGLNLSLDMTPLGWRARYRPR